MSLHALPNSPADSDDAQARLPSPSNAVTQLSDSVSAPPVRRKPSRRANTAERRATHNAVERQRRETLNGRFLDLAALLPNLSSVRRPSKSAIVNSSIAIIHHQRRSRVSAGRELRALKAEADALRREVNEWHDRANMARVDEPQRSADFMALLAEEEEYVEEDHRAFYDVRDDLDQDDDGDAEDELAYAAEQHARVAANRGLNIQTAVPFDPASALYETHLSTPDADKVAAWNAHLFSVMSPQQQLSQQLQAQQLHAQQQHQRQAAWIQQQANLFTPPASAQEPSSNPFSAAQAFYQRNPLSLPGSGTHSPAHHSPLTGSPLTGQASAGLGEDDAASAHSGPSSARASPPAAVLGSRSLSASSVASSISVSTPYELMGFNMGLANPETSAPTASSSIRPSSSGSAGDAAFAARHASAQMASSVDWTAGFGKSSDAAFALPALYNLSPTTSNGMMGMNAGMAGLQSSAMGMSVPIAAGGGGFGHMMI